jgi:K+-sensing histidine kinase KdpD
VAKIATQSKVPCEEVIQFSANPAQAIINCAKHHQCDLIFIGSHGRSGLSRLFLGSVTNKVISACTVPVLVHRASKEELAQAQRRIDQVMKPKAEQKKPRQSAALLSTF